MTHLCIVTFSIGCISTFKSYLLGVFIIGDLCEISMRVFILWVVLIMYFEY